MKKTTISFILIFGIIFWFFAIYGFCKFWIANIQESFVSVCNWFDKITRGDFEIGFMICAGILIMILTLTKKEKSK